MKLSELNFEDFKKVVSNNKSVMDIVYRNADESAYLWCDEILHNIPRAARYEISGCSYSFVNLKSCKASDILTYVNNLQYAYCVFSDDTMSLLAKYEEYSEVMEEDGYTKNIAYDDYYYMDCKCDEIREKIEKELCDYLTSFYDYNDDYAIEEAYETEALDNLDYDEETGTVTKTIVLA